MLSLNITFVLDVIYLNWVFLKCHATKVSNIEKTWVTFKNNNIIYKKEN